MANLLTKPGFEGDISSAWTLTSPSASAFAVQDSTDPRSGDDCLLIRSGSFLGGPIKSGSAVNADGFTSGQNRAVNVSFWAKGTSGQQPRVNATTATGTLLSQNTFTLSGSEYEQFTFEFSNTLTATSTLSISNPTDQTQSIRYDDFFVSIQGGPRVARLSYERSQRALLAAIQDAMASDLDNLEAEHSESLTLPDVDLWSICRLPDFVGEQVQCEVYPTGDIGWPTIERDLSTWQVGVNRSVRTRCRFIIRLTHINRDQANIQEMALRNGRYFAALIRAISDNPTLRKDSIDYVEHCIPVRGSPEQNTEIISADRSTRIARTLELEVETVQTENDSNEGSSESTAGFTAHE